MILLRSLTVLVVAAFSPVGWASDESSSKSIPLGAASVAFDLLLSTTYEPYREAINPTPDPPPIPSYLRKHKHRTRVELQSFQALAEQAQETESGNDLLLPFTPHPASKHRATDCCRTEGGQELTQPSDAHTSLLLSSYIFFHQKEIPPTKGAHTLGWCSHVIPLPESIQEPNESMPSDPDSENLEYGGIYEDDEYNDNGQIDCELCYAPIMKDWVGILQSLSCQDHCICHECLKQHIRHSDMNYSILCPGLNCQTRITAANIYSLTFDETLLGKLQEREVAAFMRSNTSTDMFACHYPDCTYIGITPLLEEPGNREWSCPKCNNVLIFTKANWNAAVKLAARPSKDDLEHFQTAKKLIADGTHKVCPKCVTLIEKNSGCHRMVCAKCKHCFCWVCLNDWGGGTENWGGGYIRHRQCNLATGETPFTRKHVPLPLPGTVIDTEEHNKSWLKKLFNYIFSN